MSMVDELNIQISADTGGAGANISNVAQSLESLGGSAENAKGDISDLVSVMSGIAQQMSQFTASVSQAVSGLTSFGSGTADLERFAASSDRASVSLTSMSDAAIYTSPRIGMMGTAAEQTRSELQSMQQGLQGALADIRTFSDNLGSAGKDAADAADKIKKLSDELPKLKTAPVTSLEAAFKKLKATVATLGIGKFLKDSNDAYVVQMQNELKLTAHMKQRMNATDEEIQSIKELASAQQQVGVIGDEIQLAGAQQLTTYAGQASTLKMLIPAMNDLIAQNAGYEASVGDATSAADMLGRALNGQYTSLKRQGIMFTEAQEQVLKYGTESQRAQVLVDAIGDKVGNMNELLANTPTGKLKQLQNDFGDLQEQLGATFQPLISSVLPAMRNVMDILAPPIKALSTGISIIGSALAALDSPATRAIGFAVAGIMIVNKLKIALGGTYTALLLIGTALTMLIGNANQSENAIGDIVTDAMNGAVSSTDNATDAAKGYEEALGDVQKAASKLAGFDTISKLSGGSSLGAFTAGLVSDEDIAKLYEAADAADAAKAEFEDFKLMPDIDWTKVGAKIYEFTHSAWNTMFKFGSDLQQLISGWGNDEKVYAPLKRMTEGIENILNAVGLDGTGFVNFWKGIGNDIYDNLAGKNSSIYRGLTEIDKTCRRVFGKLGIWVSDTFKGIGSNIYEATHQAEIRANVLAGKFDLGDAGLGGIIKDYLKQGYDSDTALSLGKQSYLSTDEAKEWYKSRDVRDQYGWADVEIWRNQMISSGQIPTPTVTPNTAAPKTLAQTQNTGIVPSNVPQSQITVNAYINDERVNADYTTINNGSGLAG